MKIKGIITEDFVNYKKVSMTIIFPYCTFKCGTEYCQNSSLAKEKEFDLDIKNIVYRYLKNPIPEAIVMQGLEPFDSWNDLYELIKMIRESTSDDIIIYTGYYENEIEDYLKELKQYPNIIVKFGRYIPNQKPHFDEVLGVELASDNQYAKVISKETT